MQSDFVGTQNDQYNIIFDLHSLSTTALQVNRKKTTELFCKNVKFCFFRFGCDLRGSSKNSKI
jgi:hypothetical protein